MFISRSLVNETNLLHIIAQQNAVEVIKCLAKEAQVNGEFRRRVIWPMLKAGDTKNSTPLHLAARLGHVDVCEQLFHLAKLCSDLFNVQKEVSRENTDDSEDDQPEKEAENTLFQYNRRSIDSNADVSTRNSRAPSTTDITQHLSTIFIVRFLWIKYRLSLLVLLP
jgi:ankyrin repeat protein